MSEEASDLIGETDARRWAAEFVRMNNANPAIAGDEDTMLAWFASAIESGRDAGAQHKIRGYRTLSPAEISLINDGKRLADEVGAWISALRSMPERERSIASLLGLPPDDATREETIDQRWVSIGATQLQQGFMAVIRGIAQPDGF